MCLSACFSIIFDHSFRRCEVKSSAVEEQDEDNTTFAAEQEKDNRFSADYLQTKLDLLRLRYVSNT